MTARHRIMAWLAASLLAAGSVQAQTWTGASENPEELLYRLDLMAAELADMRARLGVSPAPTPSGTGGSVDAARLEAQISRLTGEIEQLQFENRQLREQVERQLEDLIFRVTELEGGDPSVGGDVNLGGAPSQPLVPATEQVELDRAKADIQQGRFDQGEDRLRLFIAEYGQSPLAGEAYYWLGQSQTTRGDLTSAAKTFLGGYNANETGPFAPDNLMQLGVTLGRLGQVDAGCQTLREVTRQFPNAPQTVREGTVSELANLNCG